ncbi:MAG: helix-turn-helix domain-containing protein [Bacteroidia bacterium]
MNNRKELLSSQEYWLERIQNELFHQVQLYLKNNHKTQNDLAKDLGVGKSYVSQIINGSFDHKLSKFIELSLAVGLVPQINFKTVDQILAEEEEAYIQNHDYFIACDTPTQFGELNHILEGETFLMEEKRSKEETNHSTEEYFLSA